jgi:hypothetical protein
MRGRNRALHRLPKLIDQLNKPARLYPRPGRTLDNRLSFEASLRSHLAVLREAETRRMQAALAEAIADAPLNKVRKVEGS